MICPSDSLGLADRAASIVQLVEHLTCNERVVGSNPTGGSNKLTGMNVREKLLNLFNQHQVVPNEDSLYIADYFKFKYSEEDNIWVALQRNIMGEKISALFQRFIKEYNKHYRIAIAAKEFYQLTDEEIEDMFDELPHFLVAYRGKEKYKPNAASFLKERIWKQDYPGKKVRSKAIKLSINDFRSWGQYIAYLPEQSRSAAEAYRELISFDEFKKMVNGN